jgi:hypothetical protein
LVAQFSTVTEEIALVASPKIFNSITVIRRVTYIQISTVPVVRPKEGGLAGIPFPAEITL